MHSTICHLIIKKSISYSVNIAEIQMNYECSDKHFPTTFLPYRYLWIWEITHSCFNVWKLMVHWQMCRTQSIICCLCCYEVTCVHSVVPHSGMTLLKPHSLIAYIHNINIYKITPHTINITFFKVNLIKQWPLCSIDSIHTGANFWITGRRGWLGAKTESVNACQSNFISDLIKGNEWDVRNIDFELQAKRGDKFLCFSLFWTSKNCSYLCSQISNWDGVWIQNVEFWMDSWFRLKKSKLNIADMWLIPLACVTYVHVNTSSSCTLLPKPRFNCKTNESWIASVDHIRPIRDNILLWRTGNSNQN